MVFSEIKKEIEAIRKKKQILILAHNYQQLEVQDLADRCGDSLELSRYAAQSSAEIIVFCGVKFMAETAKILSPQKTVLLPRLDAGCPMADMITTGELEELKTAHPEAAVVSYINSTAEIKALSDICCTSSNALNVVLSLPHDEIIFVPDQNLGYYVQQRVPEKKFYIYEGFCYVHDKIKRHELEAEKAKHPHAPLIVHPEVPPECQQIADEILSTSKIINFVAQSNYEEMIIATEEGLLEKLRRDFPQKTIYSTGKARICSNMKKISPSDLLAALTENRFSIELSPKLIEKAKKPLEKMLALN